MIELIKKNHPNDNNLTFFAKEKYLKSKSKEYGWFVSDKFTLPFTIFKEFVFKRLVFSTEVIPNKNSSIKEEKEFLNEVIIFIKKNKICDFIHKPQPSVIFRTYPDNCNSFKWGTFKIDIEPSFDNMLKKVKKNQRNYIRRAIKIGVKIKITSNFNEIYKLSNDTLCRQNIPLQICENEFKEQFDTLHPENMLMFKAIYKDEIQGVLVVFFDKYNAYAEYAGSIIKPTQGSLKLLHLTAMEYLSKNYGINSYDFIGAIPDIKEGSKEAGIQKFKREFGSILKEGFQFSLVINPFKYLLFNICLKLLFTVKGIKYVDPIEKYKKLSKSHLTIKNDTTSV